MSEKQQDEKTVWVVVFGRFGEESHVEAVCSSKEDAVTLAELRTPSEAGWTSDPSRELQWHIPQLMYRRVEVHVLNPDPRRPPLPDGWRWVGDKAMSEDGVEVYVHWGRLNVFGPVSEDDASDIVDTQSARFDVDIDLVQAVLKDHALRNGL